MPKLKEVYDRFAKNGFEILGVNNDDDDALEEARTIIREKAQRGDTQWSRAQEQWHASDFE